MNVPISFQNHSPYFSVTGTIRIEIVNDRNLLLGQGTTPIDVPSNTIYDEEIETLVSQTIVTGRGQIRVYIQADLFNYGPMVINYG